MNEWIAWAGDLVWEPGAAAWHMLREAGPFVLVGLMVAGLVHVFVSREFLTRHLGGRGLGAILKAALVGAPLPLCSCSVLPTALALRERGASRGATVSFLISTPETGVDSIALTWGLMGPVMALVRPLAALVTATVAGLVESIHSRGTVEAAAPYACEECQSNDCEHVAPKKRWSRYWRFVLVGMNDDLGPTLAMGIVLAGLLTVAIPDDFFAEYLGNPWVAMLVMLVVGLPLYVCASASTPLAAALVLTKGLSPGAALVFLLVGPATNITTVLVVGRMLGKASALLYIGTIAVVSLVCGAVLDLVVGTLHIEVTAAHLGRHLPAAVMTTGGALLGAYLVLALGRRVWRWVRTSTGGQAARGTRGASAGAAAHGSCCEAGHGAAEPRAAGHACCEAEPGAGEGVCHCEEEEAASDGGDDCCGGH